ncbi:MAG: LysM peptidoglycan-binding domain-containing protein [Deltaproteobacteria bacterium]|nr:LysM peptidoglycan-binding domain-containing protein [Deltaproteobacteria bacterium]
MRPRKIRTCAFVCFLICAPLLLHSWPARAQANEQQIPHEAGVYYTIQKGDTLWDLSQRFADSHWLWPDVWGDNDQILNPHRIYPGQRIRLYHKQDVEKMAAEAPPPKPSPQKEPPETKPEAPYFLFSTIDQVGFIKPQPVQPSGRIFHNREQKTIIGPGDTIYIHPYNDDLIPGKRFTVYRTTDLTIDARKKATLGTQHYLVGIVEIIEKKEKFAIASVLRAFRSIQLEDLLMPYVKRSPKLFLKKSPHGLLGRIIGSEENEGIFADHTIAFIDKGYKNGVEPGQSYTVFYQDQKQIDPNSKETILLDPVDYGTLFVLRSEETAATVLVTRSERSISPGAKIRTPVE